MADRLAQGVKPQITTVRFRTELVDLCEYAYEWLEIRGLIAAMPLCQVTIG